MDIERILRIRREIEQGTYETDDKIDVVVDAIWEEITPKESERESGILPEIGDFLCDS